MFSILCFMQFNFYILIPFFVTSFKINKNENYVLEKMARRSLSTK